MSRAVFVVLSVVLVISSEGALAQKPSAGELTKHLRSRDEAVRLAAATQLAALGPAAAPAARGLYRALVDASPAVRKAAAEALGAIGKKAIPLVRKGLRDRKRQLEALAAAGTLGREGSVLMPDIMKLWRQETFELQKGIESAAKRIGEQAVPYLSKALGNRHDAGYAAQVLREMGPIAVAAVPDLIVLLRRRGDIGQPYAASAFGRIGDARAVPALAEAVENGIGTDTFLATVAINALGSLATMGPSSEPAVPRITKALNHARSSTMRARAALTLGRIGTDDPAALAAIRAAERSDDGEIAKAAHGALEILAPPAGAPAATLALGLHHRKKAIRLRTLDTLADLPEVPAELAAALTKRIESDSSPIVRIKSVALLGRIGTAAKQALPALKRLARGDDTELAKAARDAIARISAKER